MLVLTDHNISQNRGRERLVGTKLPGVKDNSMVRIEFCCKIPSFECFITRDARDSFQSQLHFDDLLRGLGLSSHA